MSDFHTNKLTGVAGHPAYRVQQEQKRDQLLSDLSQGLDIQHHDSAIRHTFGGAFEVPVAIAIDDPNDLDGFVGIADGPARSDHRHGISSIPWTSVGSFSNGWGNFGGGNTPVSYCKIGDFLHFRGLLSAGTIGLGAFTLPVGYRPLYTYNIGTVSNAAFGYVGITTAGVVIPVIGSNVWFSLDGAVISLLG